MEVEKELDLSPFIFPYYLFKTIEKEVRKEKKKKKQDSILEVEREVKNVHFLSSLD